ncbi:MAG: hypothetical protein ABSH24_15660 [Bryobacteraceae bacterium]
MQLVPLEAILAVERRCLLARRRRCRSIETKGHETTRSYLRLRRGVNTEEAGALASFAEIRAACPALQKVLVPDTVWPEFQDWCTHPDDVAEHRSVVWEAYVGGCLDRVTSPIHQYLLEGWSPLCTKQYRQDLQEAWMRKKQPLERHKKWRIFYGHLVELQFAAWLEEQGYAISGLEATNEKSPDVEAVSPAGVSSAFEVKFVGSQDADFEMQLKSLAGQPSCDTVSPYQAINFLAFRAYEAAKQLQRFHANRTAVLVIDRLTSGRFEPQLKEGWIN